MRDIQAYNAVYYQRNKDRLREKRGTKERVKGFDQKEYHKRYYQENKQEIRDRSRNYYIDNRLSILKACRNRNAKKILFKGEQTVVFD